MCTSKEKIIKEASITVCVLLKKIVEFEGLSRSEILTIFLRKNHCKLRCRNEEYNHETLTEYGTFYGGCPMHRLNEKSQHD